MSSIGVAATSAAVYTRLTGKSPIVKNCSRRSACFFRKAATSRASHSFSSLPTRAAISASSQFIGILLAQCGDDQLLRHRVRIAGTVGEFGREVGTDVRAGAVESFEQDGFGRLLQPEVGDAAAAAAAEVGVARQLPGARDRIEQVGQPLARERADADDRDL